MTKMWATQESSRFIIIVSSHFIYHMTLYNYHESEVVKMMKVYIIKLLWGVLVSCSENVTITYNHFGVHLDW